MQRYIPANAALIEYALYTPVDEFNQPKSAPRYAAYLLTAHGAPQGIDLGEADKIDGLIDRLRKALSDPKSTDYKVLARALDERIMQTGAQAGRLIAIIPDCAARKAQPASLQRSG